MYLFKECEVTLVGTTNTRWTTFTIWVAHWRTCRWPR